MVKPMKSIRIQVNDDLREALDRVAPAARRQRAQFIRQALIRAVMEANELRTRAAYRTQPDNEQGADDWSSAADSGIYP